MTIIPKADIQMFLVKAHSYIGTYLLGVEQFYHDQVFFPLSLRKILIHQIFLVFVHVSWISL